MVRQRKGFAEFVLQRLGARVAVGLEHRNHPPMSAGACCGECGGDFGGMVPVVVNYGLARRFMNDLEAAFGATEALECADDGFEGLSDFAGQSN